MVGHGYHLLPVELPILIPLVMVSLGRGRVIAAIASAEVTGGLGFAAKVGLDRLLYGAY